MTKIWVEYHTRGENPCGGIAVSNIGQPIAGQVPRRSHTDMNPFGIYSSDVRCENCGKRFWEYGETDRASDYVETDEEVEVD